jgi:hypothetical protein
MVLIHLLLARRFRQEAVHVRAMPIELVGEGR